MLAGLIPSSQKTESEGVWFRFRVAFFEKSS